MLNDKTVQKVLALIVVAVLFLWYRREKFEGFAEERRADKLEMHVNDIPIQPTEVMPNIYTVMSGSGYVPPKEVVMPWGDDMYEKYGKNDNLDDGENGNMGLSTNLCSPACCSEQWPTPHKLPHDKFICGNKDKYQPSNYFCNNSYQSSGCLCLKKSQAEFLANRGNNA